MDQDIERVLISREQIAARVREIALRLSHDLVADLRREGLDPVTDADHVVMMPILTGAMVFASDLIREMPLKLSMGLVAVSSYAGKTTESRGAAFRGAIPDGLTGKHVVILDDILDSGRTLKLVRGMVAEQRPASVRACVLLEKKDRRVESIEADYAGFQIPDEFVVGYGLDFDGFYRNLPEIVVLKRDVFA